MLSKLINVRSPIPRSCIFILNPHFFSRVRTLRCEYKSTFKSSKTQGSANVCSSAEITHSNTFQVGRRKFIEEGLVGKGSYGKVYKVREDGGSGSVYALKEIKVQNTKTITMVRREFRILAKCSHAHIVRLFDVDFEESSVLMLMEYCEGGNLNSRLARPSDNETNRRWMKELADAMCYLHSNNIVHRDLKPGNVLLTANDSIKLGDFGFAREYAKSDQTLLSYLKTAYMGTYAGSPYWMAPEVFHKHYTEKSDIFSLGAIFYSILTRVYMSAGAKTFYGPFVSVGGQTIGLGKAMTQNPNAMVPLDGLPPYAPTELLHKMLDYSPRNRPSAKEVLGKVE